MATLSVVANPARGLFDLVSSDGDDIGTIHGRENADRLARGWNNSACTMGVGDGTGSLFIHGDYDSIKAAQAIILENEQLRAEREQSARNLVDAWAVIAENGNIRAWASTRDHPTLKKLESQGCQVVQMVLSPATVKESLTVSGEARPPRITEQDAREIATKFFYWWHNRPGSNTMQGFVEWIEGEGSTLLDKLNADRQVPASTSAQERWDYYQTLLKQNGFGGITDLLSKYRKLVEQAPAVVAPDGWNIVTNENWNIPRVGQRVILYSNGVVQDESYTLDQADGEPGCGYYFWSRDDLDECPEVKAGDMWISWPDAAAPSHNQQSVVCGYLINNGFTEHFVKTLSDEDRKIAQRFNWDVITVYRFPSHDSEQGGEA